MQIIPKYVGSLLSATILCSVFAGATGLAFIREQLQSLPDVSPVIDYKPDIHSTVYDAAGNEVFIIGSEKRDPINLSEVPEVVVNAFIAAEDQNFWAHNGYDAQAILRAAATNLGYGSVKSGASTITQQLIKNLILTPERSIKRKVQEILLAVEVENRLSKQEILERYLNEIYLGRGAYGVVMASEEYFGKRLEELEIAEAAFLAGLPKAPSMYANDLAKGKDRRAYVLSRMHALGMISQAQYLSSDNSPLHVAKASKPIFKQSHFVQAAIDFLRESEPEGRAPLSGQEIHLTQDPKLQEIATQALQDGILSYDAKRGTWRGPIGKQDAYLLPSWQEASIVSNANGLAANLGHITVPVDKKSVAWAVSSGSPLTPGDRVVVEVLGGEAVLRQEPEVQGAIVIMNPKSGDILAMSGAFDEQTSFFNRSVMAKRQPGSALKPFIYANALETGWSPSSPILDVQLALDTGVEDEVWRPKDHGYSERGFVTLRNGLIYSRNTVTLRLFEAMGAERIREILTGLGVYDSAPDHASLALGAVETSLLNVVAGYSALAAEGKPVQPVFVHRSVNKKHDGFHQAMPAASGRANLDAYFDPITLAQVRSMLKGVTASGTARRAFNGYSRDVYGKTGTTNESKDAWFIGFNENVVVGAYVGFDDPKSLGRGASGGNVAAPIVRAVFDSLPGELQWSRYKIPPGAAVVTIDPVTGLPDPEGVAEIERLLDW